jgi:hypothetical protein
VGCGNACQAWIKAYAGQPCGYSDAYAHEIGHNLGMWHASTDTNNDGTLDCEYCDTSGFMGYAIPNLRTLNGPHKVQMGFASGPRLVDGSVGGVFTLSSLAQASAPFPQVLKFTANRGDPYYLSFRTAIGYDSTMPSASTYINRINIHRWNGSGNTRFVGALGDGQSFTDANSGLTIRQLTRTTDSVSFEVSTVCAAGTPVVSLSPASQGTGAALPATRTYTVTVTSKDSAACGAGTFSLASIVPAGWSSALSSPSLTVAPGAAASTSLTVTAPSGVVQGSYAISVATVADAAHPAASASGTFFVDLTAPSPPANLRASLKGSRVALSWNASSDAGGAGVAHYVVRRDAVQAGTSTSTTYSESPPSGTYNYTVVALDGAGNVSAPSTAVQVRIGSTRKK